MKRRQMNSVAKSLCEYLCSRNNDIRGYWGIGLLCLASMREKRDKFSFQIYPGESIRINDYEILDSKRVTVKLTKYSFDSIQAKLTFYHEADGNYTYEITIVIAKDGRTGMSSKQGMCWPHDPLRENISARVFNRRFFIIIAGRIIHQVKIVLCAIFEKLKK